MALGAPSANKGVRENEALIPLDQDGLAVRAKGVLSFPARHIAHIHKPATLPLGDLTTPSQRFRRDGINRAVSFLFLPAHPAFHPLFKPGFIQNRHLQGLRFIQF